MMTWQFNEAGEARRPSDVVSAEAADFRSHSLDDPT